MWSPSAITVEQIPWYGQSFTRPLLSFGRNHWYRNFPSDSRKIISTPPSASYCGSRLASLLVPTNTSPPATTGLPYDCDPSCCFHLMFCPDSTFHSVGGL